jgi:alpha-tubulin suppressor-like RCC1 family protein
MDNTVECWGGNNSEKTTVPNGLVAKQIALGLDHACAIKLDVTLKCWGGLPKGSPSQLIVKRVALGNEMTCAIKLDGSVQSWEGGLGNHGFLSIDMPNGLIAKKIAEAQRNLFSN